MGLLDSIIGGLTGAGGTAGGSPMESMVMGLLNSQGGVQGLIGNFERAGLGSVVQSWIGNGANQSVNPDQLRSALGEGQVQNMAAQAGVEPETLLAQLAQHLPGLVDRMTPGGQVPAAAGSPGAASGSAWDDTTST